MRRSNTINLGETISEYIRESHLEGGLMRVRIYDAWDDLMAEIASPSMSAEEAKALTSSKFYKDKVLTCRISSSLVRTQLRFQLDSLRDRLNARLGGPYVDRINLS